MSLAPFIVLLVTLTIIQPLASLTRSYCIRLIDRAETNDLSTVARGMLSSQIHFSVGIWARSLRPATAYRNAPDVGLLTCYFNPCGYQSLRRNYDLFHSSILGSGLELGQSNWYLLWRG